MGTLRFLTHAFNPCSLPFSPLLPPLNAAMQTKKAIQHQQLYFTLVHPEDLAKEIMFILQEVLPICASHEMVLCWNTKSTFIQDLCAS